MLKVRLIQIGKNQETFIEAGIGFYENKLRHYCQFENLILPALKQTGTLSKDDLRKKEGELLIKHLNAKSWVVLLDERGKQHDSLQWAETLGKWTVAGQSQIDFLIGGAFGFSEQIYARANYQLSLSKMTFSHQLIRIIFLEQLYRMFTILKNEPYHHT
jgi:23S rRNA (pseudouridine1915-N3)-methyltransferase